MHEVGGGGQTTKRLDWWMDDHQECFNHITKKNWVIIGCFIYNLVTMTMMNEITKLKVS